MHEYLAVDLGAESGRVVRGRLDADRLSWREVSRFPTGMVSVLERKHWNLLRLYEEMLKGLAVQPDGVESIGVDSWGVDFVLLGSDGQPVGPAVAYRDRRTDGLMDEFFRLVPAAEVYAATGIQFLPFNTLFQLFALARGGSGQLAAARTLLMVPDYFHYLLTGVARTEYTNASTTQCLNVSTRTWDRSLLSKAGVRPELFAPMVMPGTVLGTLTAELQRLTGAGGVPVIASATHDTASAVAAVPAEGDDWAYISSGTWSLVGVETRSPVATEQARAFNFTNEGGVGGTIRLLRNVIGLWLVQQLRAELAPEMDYAALTAAAEQAPPFACLVDPDDSGFLAPASMARAFDAYCARTGQAAPRDLGAYVRCALDSLALEYRLALERAALLSGRAIRRVHVIGGGSRNALLCQLTADVAGVDVLAGPAEATALGNLAVQAIALGHLDSLAQARRRIAQSCELTPYRPRPGRNVEPAWRRFLQLKGIA